MNEEYGFVSYNMLDDYIRAKQIMQRDLNKLGLRKYLRSVILDIRDQKIGNYNSIDVLIICGLYAERYSEECIDIIGDICTPDKIEIVNRYINSFYGVPQNL